MFVCFIVQVRILFCRLFKLLIFPISELHIFHFITFCQEKSHVHSVKPIRPFDAINEVRLSLMSHNCYYFFFFFKPSGLQPISATQYLHINTHCLDKELILLGLANNIFLHPDHWVICSGYLKVSFQQWIEREREREDGWPFTGLQLSRLHTPKPGKCQVFLKNVRSYISLLFIPSFSRPPSPFMDFTSFRCLSLPDNVSTSGVSCKVWSSHLFLCLHPFFHFMSLLILSPAPHFSDVLLLPFDKPNSASFLSLSGSLLEFRGG